jgi:hypothetical protein
MDAIKITHAKNNHTPFSINPAIPGLSAVHFLFSNGAQTY